MLPYIVSYQRFLNNDESWFPTECNFLSRCCQCARAQFPSKKLLPSLLWCLFAWAWSQQLNVVHTPSCVHQRPEDDPHTSTFHPLPQDFQERQRGHALVLGSCHYQVQHLQQLRNPNLFHLFCEEWLSWDTEKLLESYFYYIYSVRADIYENKISNHVL